MAGRLVQDIRTTFSAAGMSDVKTAAGEVGAAVVDANKRQEQSWHALDSALKAHGLAATKAAKDRVDAARMATQGTAAQALEAEAKAEASVAKAETASARVGAAMRDMTSHLGEDQKKVVAEVTEGAAALVAKGATQVEAYEQSVRKVTARIKADVAGMTAGNGRSAQEVARDARAPHVVQRDRFRAEAERLASYAGGTQTPEYLHARRQTAHYRAAARRAAREAVARMNDPASPEVLEAARAQAARLTDPRNFEAGRLAARHADRRTDAEASVQATPTPSARVSAALRDEAAAVRHVTEAIAHADEAERARALHALADARTRTRVAQEEAARELRAQQDASRAEHEHAADVLRVATLRAQEVRAEEAAAERVARAERTADATRERLARAAATEEAKRLEERRKKWVGFAQGVKGAMEGVQKTFEFFNIPSFMGTVSGALTVVRALTVALGRGAVAAVRLTTAGLRLGAVFGRHLFMGAVHGAERLVGVIARLVRGVARLALRLAEVGRQSLTGVLHALERAAGLATRWATRAAAVGAAHTALMGREGVKGVESINGDAKDLRDQSVAMNLKPDTIQKIQGLAREHDVDPAKLMAAVSHVDDLIQKAKDPSSKEAALLATVDVPTGERDPVTGRMTDRNPVDVMRDALLRVYDPASQNANTRNLGGGNRDALLKDLIGDSAPEAREALRALGTQGQGALEGGLRRERNLGTYISPQDLAAVRQYRDAVEGMQEALKGLRHTVGRVLTPLFTKLSNVMTLFLAYNRESIAGYITNHVQAAVTSLALVGNLIERETDIGTKLWGLFSSENPQLAAVTTVLRVYKFYLNYIKGGLVSVGHAAMWAGHAISRAFVVGHAYWVVYYREQFQLLWQSAKEVGREIGQWGHENNLDTFQGWADVFRTVRDMAVEAYQTIRDGAVEAFTVAREYALLFWQAVGKGEDVGKDHSWLQHLATWRNAVVAYLRQAWADIRMVMKGEDKVDSTGTDPIQTWVGRQAQNVKWLIKVLPPLWAKAKAVIKAGLTQAKKLWADFKAIWGGKQATNFPWLNTLVSAFKTVVDRVKEAIGIFQALYGAAQKVFDFFGQDVGKWLIVLGLLRLTGILGLATAGFGAAMGAVRLFGGALGVIGAIFGGGGFMAGLRMLMAAMGMAGAGGAAAVTAATTAVASGEAAMGVAGAAGAAGAAGGAAGVGGAAGAGALTAPEFAAGGGALTEGGLGLMGGFAAGGLGLAGGILYGGSMATAKALQEAKANMAGVRANAQKSDEHDFAVLLGLRDKVDAMTFRGDNDRAGRLSDFELNAKRVITPIEKAAISRLRIDLAINGKDVATKLHDLDGSDGILRAIADNNHLIVPGTSTVP